MNEITSKILEFIGTIIGVGGAIALISFGVLKYFGKKWLDKIFDERLEKFKRYQNEEFENFRFKINSLFNRITKIHQREFEVIPSLWKKLLDVLGDIDLIIQKEDHMHPNFNYMKTNAIKIKLTEMKWEDNYINEVLENRDKNAKFLEIDFWNKFVKTQKSMADLHNYLWYNTIFLSDDLYNEFKKLDNLIYDSVNDIEVGKRTSSEELREQAFNKIREESKEYISNLEKMIQKRLHFDEAT